MSLNLTDGYATTIQSWITQTTLAYIIWQGIISWPLPCLWSIFTATFFEVILVKSVRFFFLLLHFFSRPPYFYPSIFVFTHPNDGWTGLYIKLWLYVCNTWILQMITDWLTIPLCRWARCHLSGLNQRLIPTVRLSLIQTYLGEQLAVRMCFITL